ncbi:hypothetical protein [Bradyrhizobium tropiciagri]|uniref:hypothetical protein n=1 Tax=Bradyrhizobium tropiciagri TaxID=312253 RepID=UPI00067BD550|nr:hypothetical protein [Bradyrhizobium tropiciagri]
MQHLEFEALKIIAALEDMNDNKVALAAARALAEALADVIEEGAPRRSQRKRGIPHQLNGRR